MKKKLALVYGGASGEHDVSITSAFSIMSNIDYSLFTVKPIYVTKENRWFEQGWHSECPKTQSQLVVTHNKSYNPLQLSADVDVVFPITHGPYGEDGHFQAIFELANVPYVGCDLLASAVGMDKAVMKDVFDANNIPQGKYLYYYEHEFKNNPETLMDHIEKELHFPCFIKPSNLGSSVGISKATNQAELKQALETAFSYDEKVVVEEFIQAREIEIGVLGNESYQLSALGEISTSADFYDYEAKYISTSQNKMMIPTQVPADIEKEIRRLAEQVAKVINVKGLSRIDFFYREADNRLFVNEINTLPGFTRHSMYPSLFAEVGIGYSELITRLISLAEERFNSKKRTPKAEPAMN